MATASASSSSSDRKRKRIDAICLGTDDFDKIIKEKAAFVDKTMFIKEWMEKGDEVSVILRPRRFGKSTNLSMLKSFFSFGAQSQHFSRFLIGKEIEFIKKHCGKYPVVFLNMSGIAGGENWEGMLNMIWLRLRDAIYDQKRHLDEDDMAFIGVNYRDATAQPNETIAGGFLKRLTRRLQKKYIQRVIVLIDEYDAPLNHAFRKGFYEKASSFFGEFYSNGLKSNFALKRACLIGIVEIRAGMYSGLLNNLVIYSSADERFSEYFGFTRDEVEDFLDRDEKRIQDVMKWYNGYYMGSHQVINPWSFVNYVDTGELKSYWVQTANIDSLSTALSPVLSLELIKILGELYEGKEHEIGELSTKVNYDDDADTDLILAFLVHTGYLTYKEGRVSMPNREVKYEWGDHVLGLADYGPRASQFQQSVTDALYAKQFDIATLESVMRGILIKCSYHDLQSENSYHLFYFGIFIMACGASRVSSNLEAGYGGYDVQIALNKWKRLIIFEFKVSKDANDLEKDAKQGLKQIQEKEHHNDQGHVLQLGCHFLRSTCPSSNMNLWKADAFS